MIRWHRNRRSSDAVVAVTHATFGSRLLVALTVVECPWVRSGLQSLGGWSPCQEDITPVPGRAASAGGPDAP
jgi:hypothetical protein